MRRKTAHFIEERRALDAGKAADTEGAKPAKPKYKQHPNSLKNLAKPWPKGTSGNPGGLPGVDVAAMAARDFFRRYPTISAAMARELRGFNGYGFSVLADRAFGKLTDRQHILTTGVTLEQVLLARKRADKLIPQPRPDTPADTDAGTPASDVTDVPDNQADV
jgi:hypothetical protein